MADKVKMFHPIVQRRTIALSGGFAPTKNYVPESRHIKLTHGHGEADGDKQEYALVAHDNGQGEPHGETKECVLVSHDRAWLCEMATGLPVYQRPLARVHILRELPELITAARGTGETEGDGKMACLRYDDEDSEELETPKKNSVARKHKRLEHPRSRRRAGRFKCLVALRIHPPRQLYSLISTSVGVCG